MTANSIRFQPTRPLRGATTAPSTSTETKTISTHAPLAGRDGLDLSDQRHDVHFNPRAPCGARHLIDQLHVLITDFNPRAPCGARPSSGASSASVTRFQPTRPLRGATRYQQQDQRARQYFNPRAPCGARQDGSLAVETLYLFQPTRPLRGATQRRPAFLVETAGISTHAPLAGRDEEAAQMARTRRKFQPTRPLRGATQQGGRMSWDGYNFNPRAPCGARPPVAQPVGVGKKFQPTRPLRGATLTARAPSATT